jgi:hypothetical protein
MQCCWTLCGICGYSFHFCHERFVLTTLS